MEKLILEIWKNTSKTHFRFKSSEFSGGEHYIYIGPVDKDEIDNSLVDLMGGFCFVGKKEKLFSLMDFRRRYRNEFYSALQRLKSETFDYPLNVCVHIAAFRDYVPVEIEAQNPNKP